MWAAFRRGMRRSADFRGRTRRSEYFKFWLATALVTAPFAAAAVATFVVLWGQGIAAEDRGESSALGDLTWQPTAVALALLAVVLLVLALPSFAAQVRRLHDGGLPGAWTLLNLVGLGFVPLFLCLAEPRPGSERWGPDPRSTDGVVA